MNYIPFGKTDARVSQIAYGCMSLTPERKDEGKKTVQRAFELGINFFDTADVYGGGDSERILGEAIQEGAIPRDHIFIASKCGIVFPGMEPSHDYKAYDLTAGYIKRSVEDSLRRIGTDYLDLYQPHRIDYLTHPEETAKALDDLQREGKILHAGVSNYSPLEIDALMRHTRLESLQTHFSLLYLAPFEKGLLPFCQARDMSVLCWSPLEAGILTGRTNLPHDDWRRQRSAGAVTQLRELADANQTTLTGLSLAWLMQIPGGVIPLVGTASPAHIEEAVAACNVTLRRDEWYECMVIGRGRPMPWEQPPYVYLHDS